DSWKSSPPRDGSIPEKLSCTWARRASSIWPLHLSSSEFTASKPVWAVSAEAKAKTVELTSCDSRPAKSSDFVLASEPGKSAFSLKTAHSPERLKLLPAVASPLALTVQPEGRSARTKTAAPAAC